MKHPDTKTEYFWGFILIVCFLAIGLATLTRQAQLGRTPATPPGTTRPPTSTDVVTQPPKPQALTEASCTTAHGHWNSCGSLCRGKPDAVCAQVCIPMCECGGIAGWSCPKDMMCTDYLPGPQVPDAMGICKPSGEVTKEPTPEPGTEQPTPMPTGFEYKSKDGVTSVMVEPGYPIRFHGTSTAFESRMSWELRAPSVGKVGYEVVGQGAVYVHSPDSGVPGALRGIAGFDDATSAKIASGLFLDVFEHSAKDGSPVHEAIVPITLPSELMSADCAHAVSLYEWKGSEPTMACTQASVPVSRSICTAGAPSIEALLIELLRGQTVADAKGGFTTPFDGDIALPTVETSGNATKITFTDPRMHSIVATCGAFSIKKSIEKTLRMNGALPSKATLQILIP